MARRKSKGYYKRGNRWQVDTSYRGIPIREAVATPEMAEKVIRKAKILIDEDRYLEKKRKSDVTLGAFAERYLKWCETEGQKAIKDKKSRIRAMVGHFGPGTRLADLNVDCIEAYKENRLSQPGERKKKIKPATVNRELANFKHLCSKAVEWGVLESNPAVGVKLLPVKNRSLRYLDADELRKLLEASSAYLRPVITLAVNTGLRRGELLRLRWKDIDWPRGLLEVKDQKNGELSYLPLNRTAVGTLRQVPRRLGSPYVFARANGQPPVDFKYHFKQALEASKIDHCRFHDTRHTFASHLAMSGVDLLTIKKLMRHKTMAMTLRYAHLSDQHTKSAVERLSFEPQNERKEAL